MEEGDFVYYFLAFYERITRSAGQGCDVGLREVLDPAELDDRALVGPKATGPGRSVPRPGVRPWRP